MTADSHDTAFHAMFANHYRRGDDDALARQRLPSRDSAIFSGSMHRARSMEDLAYECNRRYQNRRPIRMALSAEFATPPCVLITRTAYHSR